MERIEYDPQGGDYLPVTERETASTLMVAGVVMLLGALGWALYVGGDIRVGGMLMRTLFSVDVVIALTLITWGYIKKKRVKK